jgi:hypothetical protein
MLPALTVMEPPGPSPPVEVEMSAPPNIVSLGVLTVTAPAVPVPNETEEIALGLFTTVVDPKLNGRVLCPEIDSCSDAVTDTVPADPDPSDPKAKFEVVIPASSVKLIVAAWTFTSPAPPGPTVEDAIQAPFRMRAEVDTKTGPACPKPKAALVMPLGTSC